MVDVNPNASSLQAQLQAQLQGSGNRVSKSGVNLTPTPQDSIKERVDARQNEANRQAPSQRPARSNELSSYEDLAIAQEKVSAFDANRREAPVGRLSAQSDQRDVPLGQVIDIRV